MVFCGTHRIEELASDYWSVLFNISLYHSIGFLEKDEAFHLIKEPVKEFNMRYDDLALDKMWRITAGLLSQCRRLAEVSSSWAHLSYVVAHKRPER